MQMTAILSIDMKLSMTLVLVKMDQQIGQLINLLDSCQPITDVASWPMRVLDFHSTQYKPSVETSMLVTLQATLYISTV